MHRIITRFVLAAAFVAASAALASTPAAAAGAATYSIDPTHSEVSFVVRHFVSNVRGHFKDFAATIVRNDQDLAQASVEFTVQVASIDTGVEKRDNHLRSADFFDAATYPTLTFKSRKVEKASESQYRVTGDLTMRGVTKVVTLDVDYAGEMPDGFGGVRAGFSTSTKLNRKDFNISWNRALDGGGFMLSDDVKVEINLEAIRQQ